MIPALAGWKAKAAVLSGTFLAGSLGGGWAVHKLWWGASQKAKLEATETALATTKDALSTQRTMAINETARANRLAADLSRTQSALDAALAANVSLAASRASTTTRIIQGGEDVADAITEDGSFAWIRYAWPDRLRDYANGDAGPGGVSATQGGDGDALAGGPVPGRTNYRPPATGQ